VLQKYLHLQGRSVRRLLTELLWELNTKWTYCVPKWRLGRRVEVHPSRFRVQLWRTHRFVCSDLKDPKYLILLQNQEQENTDDNLKSHCIVGRGGACLWSQHSGVWGRRIMSSWPVWTTIIRPPPKKKLYCKTPHEVAVSVCQNSYISVISYHYT
jgi:hypothetical protein